MSPSSVRLPPNPKVEIEFTAGVWTDVTKDLYPDVIAPNTRFGRTSPFSQTQPAEFSVALDNSSQNYTPQNTSSIYYPNVQRRKRIRYSYNPGTQRFRFTGYIKQWKPTLIAPDGGDGRYFPVMQIAAKCRMDQLARVKMLAPIHQEIIIDGPFRWWPLTDGQAPAVEQSGGLGTSFVVAGTGTAPTFGDNGPGAGDGPGVKFAAGQYLANTAQAGTLLPGATSSAAYGFEVWANTASATDGAVLSLSDTRLGLLNVTVAIMGATNGGKPRFLGQTLTAAVNGPAAVNDGGWHHFAVTYNAGTWTFYVDGVSAGTTGGAAAGASVNLIRVGQSDTGSTSMLFTGNVGEVATYTTSLGSVSRIQAHTAAGLGYYGDTTDQRIARYLGYLGNVASVLDGGVAVVNTYPQAGVDVLTGCQDMATTEGGGAVFYTTASGNVRFENRRYRDNRTPALTLVAAGDLDPSIYEPSLDDDGLVTQMTANRASESGTQTAQTYSSGASDVFASDVTTYTISDADALALAQYAVNAQTVQALRFPQIAVYLDQADHDLYDAIGQLQIGDRVRVSFPAVAYPIPSVDFFLEGWTEQPDPASGGYRFTMDVSPADIPGPRFQLDVSTLDGPDVLAL